MKFGYCTGEAMPIGLPNVSFPNNLIFGCGGLTLKYSG